MIANKHITKIIAVIVAIAVIACLSAAAFANISETGVTMEYESKLFDTDEIISVNIIMDESDWNDLLGNAIDEEYYKCDVVINGTTIKNVGIRAKGNTSLSSIVSDPDSDRYSLKLEFDHYEKGQTCFGLDKLVLNNNFADATNMKEAIVYDMFQFLGADASLYNYANVEVNGEYWGVYLALEGVEDSFMLRNFSTSRGELYKPESMGMGGGADDEMSDMPDMSEMPDMSQIPDMQNGDTNFEPPERFSTETMPDSSERSSTDSDMPQMPGNGNMPQMPGARGNMQMPGGNMPNFDGENMPEFDGEMPDMSDLDPSEFGGQMRGGMNGGMGGGFSSNSGGADLNYTDDELDSYSTIWDGAQSKISTKDKAQVVTALKNISEGTDLEKYLDVDNVLRYMAVHTFVVNLDSLSGNMAHNYYLYESGGQLNIIPWDYNLSFGGMTGGNDASNTINYAIDTPFSGTNFFDALLENEEYLEQYHEYLRQLIEEYVYGGVFEETYNRIRSQIDELVETDPTAFFTYEEYEDGVEMLYKVVILRAESVEGQLDGTIPSTTSGQREDSSNLVDASDIDISVMGTFMSGGGNMGGNFFPGGRGNMGEPNGDFTPPDQSTDNESTADSETTAPTPPSGDSDTSAQASSDSERSFEGFTPETATRSTSSSGLSTTAVTNLEYIGVCLVIITAALAFALLFKRKSSK